MFSPAFHCQRDYRDGGFPSTVLEDPYLIKMQKWTQVCSQSVNMKACFSMLDIYIYIYIYIYFSMLDIYIYFQFLSWVIMGNK